MNVGQCKYKTFQVKIWRISGGKKRGATYTINVVNKKKKKKQHSNKQTKTNRKHTQELSKVACDDHLTQNIWGLLGCLAGKTTTLSLYPNKQSLAANWLLESSLSKLTSRVQFIPFSKNFLNFFIVSQTHRLLC